MVTVQDKEITHGKPCFIIAEVGVNHDGCLDRAHQLIDVAAEVGADAVKFQTFRTASLVSPNAAKAAYQMASSSAESDQASMLRKLELSFDAFYELRDHAQAKGLVFLSTPFDGECAHFLLKDLDLPIMKTGSGDLTDVLLMRTIAQYGKPVLVSTGMSTMEEVAFALETLSPCPIVLLHCTSAYPAPFEDANLRAINTLRERFVVPVGLSDHSIGSDLAVAAVAMGAVCIEKHLTYDVHAHGPDHAASCDPEGFRDLVTRVRRIESAMGNGLKVPMPSEMDVRKVARKSIHLAVDLKMGSVITANDLVLLRPDDGIPPTDFDAVVGRRIKVARSAGDPLRVEDLV